MAYNTVIYERLDDGIIRITLNRPKNLNAINSELGRELALALKELQSDKNASVAILTGAGRAFCAGADLKDPAFSGSGGDSEDFFSVIRQIKIPLIAAVNGYAITGGLELALSCDIVIASENAAFRDTHVQAGIIPGGGNTQRLPRLVGEKKAKEILFASEFISARDAERINMINRVVPVDELEEETMLLAKKIAAQPRQMIQKMKHVIDTGMGMEYRTALVFEKLESTNSILSMSSAQFIDQGKDIIQGGQSQAKKDQ